MKEEEIIKGTRLFQPFQTLSQRLVCHDLAKYYREGRSKNKQGPASLSQRSLRRLWELEVFHFLCDVFGTTNRNTAGHRREANSTVMF